MRNNRNGGTARTAGRPLAFLPLGRDAMLLVIAWAAGYMDAISYVGLGHVFTANMTGNTVLLGLALGEGKESAARRSVAALGGFVLGVTLGTLIVGRSQKEEDWPPAVTRAVTLERVILGVFAIAWYVTGAPSHDSDVYALIVLSALAMGFQSTAIRRLGVAGITTTYITGTWTSFTEGLVGWLRSLAVSLLPSRAPGSAPTARQEHSLSLQAAILFIYGLGAVTSGSGETRWSPFVAVLPFGAVALVVLNAAARHRYG
jgi:uncharacterized membrane protein YoaK (UPF0700 family)